MCRILIISAKFYMDMCMCSRVGLACEKMKTNVVTEKFHMYKNVKHQILHNRSIYFLNLTFYLNYKY